MTNQQILDKAIAKAIEGGWIYKGSALEIIDGTVFVMDALDGDAKPLINAPDYWSILIFNHDFAEALWGEVRSGKPPVHVGKKPSKFDELEDWTGFRLGWQYQLQQMVIAEDPIAYLGDNLPQ